MTTTAPCSVNNDYEERYYNTQIIIIVITVLTGLGSLIFLLLCIRNRLKIRRIAPQDYVSNQKSIWEYLKYNICCFNEPIEDFIPSRTEGYNRFVDQINLIFENALSNINFEENNISEVNNEDENEICKICFEKINMNTTKILLPCGHSYHKECIVEWFREGRNECPECKAIIIV